MLYEITHVRPSRRGQSKRWFTSIDMDLFVWFRNGVPVHFQLYIDKRARERVICWDIRDGFNCYLVNNTANDECYGLSPVAVSFSRLELRVLARSFLAACENIDADLGDYIYARLMEIPDQQEVTPVYHSEPIVAR